MVIAPFWAVRLWQRLPSDDFIITSKILKWATPFFKIQFFTTKVRISVSCYGNISILHIINVGISHKNLNIIFRKHIISRNPAVIQVLTDNICAFIETPPNKLICIKTFRRIPMF